MKALGSPCWLCLGLALMVPAACVAARSASPDRTAELEARIVRLEGLIAQEAGVSRLEGADAGSPAQWAREHIGIGCVSNAEQFCRTMVQGEQKRQQRLSADGGLAWIRTAPEQPADATELGRACLEQQRAECFQERERDRKRDAHFAWLDAQLTPDRIDRIFSEKVKARLDQTDPYGPYEVACTAQFCRLRNASDASSHRGCSAVLHTEPHPSGGAMRLTWRNGYEYCTRVGFQFPSY